MVWKQALQTLWSNTEESRILQNIKQVFLALPASILSEHLISSTQEFSTD